ACWTRRQRCSSGVPSRGSSGIPGRPRTATPLARAWNRTGPTRPRSRTSTSTRLRLQFGWRISRFGSASGEELARSRSLSWSITLDQLRLRLLDYPITNVVESSRRRQNTGEDETGDDQGAADAGADEAG